MIEVYSNGCKFPYWTSANVTRSVSNIAATFSLTLVSRDESGNHVGLFSGDSVQIAVNNQIVIDGYVDKVSAGFSGSGSTLTVSGFEKTCDLVDCCVIGKTEFKGRTLDQILSEICKQFGVTFSNKMGVNAGKPFENFSAETGSKAVEVIAKLCKERGVLPCSNGFGLVYLLDPMNGKRGPALKQGVNLLNASADYSINGRYSEYTVYGTGKAKKEVKAVSKDSYVTRSRPFVIVDSNATEKESVVARADWEMSTRKSKSLNVKCSVKGWCSSGSELWEPGELVSFESVSAFAEVPVDLVVSQVNYQWGSSGEITNLTLVQPESFVPQPESKKVIAAKPVKTDAWATIKKVVKK